MKGEVQEKEEQLHHAQQQLQHAQEQVTLRTQSQV